MKVIAYLRVSTDKQECANQRFEAENFCKRRSIEVTEWIEEIMSGTIFYKDRKVGNIITGMKRGDILLVSELSRLSRKLFQIMEILKKCLDEGIIIMTIKEGFILGDDINSKILAFAFGIAAEIERNMISLRTIEGLQRRKSEGVVLGRPIGSKRSILKLDQYKSEIEGFINKGLSYSSIARIYDCHRQTMTTYCKKSGFREGKINPFNKSNKTVAIDWDHAFELYKTNTSLTAVAKLLDVHPNWFVDRLKEYDLFEKFKNYSKEKRERYNPNAMGLNGRRYRTEPGIIGNNVTSKL